MGAIARYLVVISDHPHPYHGLFKSTRVVWQVSIYDQAVDFSGMSMCLRERLREVGMFGERAQTRKNEGWFIEGDGTGEEKGKGSDEK